jgi:hypothetical protein
VGGIVRRLELNAATGVAALAIPDLAASLFSTYCSGIRGGAFATMGGNPQIPLPPGFRTGARKRAEVGHDRVTGIRNHPSTGFKPRRMLVIRTVTSKIRSNCLP